MHKFGSRVKAARLRRGLTQAELADKLEAHRKTVSRWESGKDVPSFHTGCRLAQALKINALHLAGLTESPTQGTQLSADETELLAVYRELNSEERLMWRESIRDAGSVTRIARKAKS